MSLFFFNDRTPSEIYTLSLHDALPILWGPATNLWAGLRRGGLAGTWLDRRGLGSPVDLGFRHSLTACLADISRARSEEHTSELQSRQYLVCRLLLEKKKKCLSRDALIY